MFLVFFVCFLCVFWFDVLGISSIGVCLADMGHGHDVDKKNVDTDMNIYRLCITDAHQTVYYMYYRNTRAGHTHSRLCIMETHTRLCTIDTDRNSDGAMCHTRSAAKLHQQMLAERQRLSNQLLADRDWLTMA